MHSLMQKMTAAAILFVFFLASAHVDDTASVPSALDLLPSPSTIQFVKVYTAYAKAVRDHGVEGLKTFVTHDFTLRGNRLTLSGEAALKELRACKVDLPGTRFNAAVHPLSVTGTDAVALAHENYTSRMKISDHNTSVALTYDWKQTWCVTPQGWKLAGMEPYRGDFDHVAGMTYTVLPQPESAPAKTQAKQNVVK